MMRILAISGSLRAASSNTILLSAAAALAPENVEVVVYRGLGDLPHFNPHLDKEPAPPAVTDFRTQLGKSSGVIISSPEYAHGVPGVLKNGLDWLVASGELYDKPVALFSASPRATFALASLTETLKVMTARLVAEASITVPLLGKNFDESGVVSDPEDTHALDVVKALDAMGIAIRGGDLASLPLLKRMGVTAAVRASCYAYTSAEEIDLLVAALQNERRGFS